MLYNHSTLEKNSSKKSLKAQKYHEMMSVCYPDVRIFKSLFDILKGKQQLQNQKEFEQKKFKFAWFIYTKIKKQKKPRLCSIIHLEKW